MARVTVEDCIDKVESPYELVLVAKERTTQLNSGMDPTLERDNENLYKGEVSKSGTPILPSKRARKVPEKIQVTKEDLSELNQNPEISDQNIPENSNEDVSLDTIKEQETENLPKEETETSNS